MNNLIVIIFTNQVIFLLILILLRFFFKKKSIHLISIIILTIAYYPITSIYIYYSKSFDLISLTKIYVSNCIFFSVMLSTLERSVALGIIRKIFLKKIVTQSYLENNFNINKLIDKRLKNLNQNKMIKFKKDKIVLTSFGKIIYNIISKSIKIFK